MASAEIELGRCRNEISIKQREIDSLKSELLQKQFSIRQLQESAPKSDAANQQLIEMTKLYESTKSEKEELEKRFQHYIELDSSTAAAAEISEEPLLELLDKKDEEIRKLHDERSKLLIENAKSKREYLGMKMKFDKMLEKMQCVSPRNRSIDSASSERVTFLTQDNAILVAENADMKTEIAKLKDMVAKFEVEVAQQSVQIDRLNSDMNKKDAENANFEAECSRLSSDIDRKQKALIKTRCAFRKFKRQESKNSGETRNDVKQRREELKLFCDKSLVEFNAKCRSCLKSVALSPSNIIDSDASKIIKLEKDNSVLAEKLEKHIKDSKDFLERERAKHAKQLEMQVKESLLKSQENERLLKIEIGRTNSMVTELGQYKIHFNDGLAKKDAKKRFTDFVSPQSDNYKRILQENLDLRKKLSKMEKEYRMCLENSVSDVQKNIKLLIQS